VEWQEIKAETWKEARCAALATLAALEPEAMRMEEL
jgi:hypothetical protein